MPDLRESFSWLVGFDCFLHLLDHVLCRLHLRLIGAQTLTRKGVGKEKKTRIECSTEISPQDRQRVKRKERNKERKGEREGEEKEQKEDTVRAKDAGDFL